MSSMPSVLITCGHLIRNIENFRSLFSENNIDLTVPDLDQQQFSAQQMNSLLPGHDLAILGDDHITEETIHIAKPTLKFLIKWGIGTDNIDLVSAQNSNIPVYNTPGQFSGEVADLAIGLMLNLARQINVIDRSVRQGNWPRYEGETIAGTNAHIIGMGNIGQALAKRLKAFDVNLTGSDVSSVKDTIFPQVPLEDGLANADWVFVACALTRDSYHLINKNKLSQMKDGAFIINVARGPIINEGDLIKYLLNGKLKGAGLDVYESEPLSKNSKLISLNNVVLGSHGGSSTKQAIERVNALTVSMAIKLLKNKGKNNKFNQVN